VPDLFSDNLCPRDGCKRQSLGSINSTSLVFFTTPGTGECANGWVENPLPTCIPASNQRLEEGMTWNWATAMLLYIN